MKIETYRSIKDFGLSDITLSFNQNQEFVKNENKNLQISKRFCQRLWSL